MEPHMQPKSILDARGVERIISRIAHEILERNRGARHLVILGIPTRGVHLARRLADRIAEIEGVAVPVGAIDATLYRDDIALKEKQPLLKQMVIPIPIVLTIRQPPINVPSPIAAWQVMTTQNGT